LFSCVTGSISAILADDSAKVFGVDPLPSAFNAANITCARANNGTNAAYAYGCVCSECREHQRIRIARNR
jgi:hypothetical protein